MKNFILLIIVIFLSDCSSSKYTVSGKHKKIARGDFNGDGKMEWLSYTLRDKKGCSFNVYFSDKNIPSIYWEEVFITTVINEGDLDGKKGDEISVWQMSCEAGEWTEGVLYSFKNGRWVEVTYVHTGARREDYPGYIKKDSLHRGYIITQTYNRFIYNDSIKKYDQQIRTLNMDSLVKEGNPELIFEGSSLGQIGIEHTSSKKIEKYYGKGKITKHKKRTENAKRGYSAHQCITLEYDDLGLKFEAGSEKMGISDAEISLPFKAKTTKGIELGVSTGADVIKLYGRPKQRSGPLWRSNSEYLPCCDSVYYYPALGIDFTIECDTLGTQVNDKTVYERKNQLQCSKVKKIHIYSPDLATVQAQKAYNIYYVKTNKLKSAYIGQSYSHLDFYKKSFDGLQGDTVTLEINKQRVNFTEHWGTYAGGKYLQANKWVDGLVMTIIGSEIKKITRDSILVESIFEYRDSKGKNAHPDKGFVEVHWVPKNILAGVTIYRREN